LAILNAIFLKNDSWLMQPPCFGFSTKFGDIFPHCLVTLRSGDIAKK
jgi:hypothetical protein